MSQRQLADEADVSQSHLSRLLRQADSRIRPSADLMRRISLALDLPPYFFRESREDLIIKRLQSDDEFLDGAFELLRKFGPRQRASRR